MIQRLAYPPAEAARLLGLSQARIYQLLADGSLPSLKIGKSRRIRHEAIVAFLDLYEAEARVAWVAEAKT